ncbi:ROK family protein [Alkalispirochaeta americana]|uniref:ROK family protein n=1 Tax=Alkalispirochaeta americana TaxID=159291 RepID=A0A1N6RJ21_9SPIO|nr:ROK family transcriptional regulator [Alkalispirochaeta americana]SIQ28854.1 ROK family protein [Alkalispirochaeta americana]
MKLVGNSRYQKAANGSLLLDFLRRSGGASRRRISRELGLQPSTVTYIVNRLLQAGLVVESGFGGNDPADSSDEPARGSGRRATRIVINPTYGAVIGLDLQADYYKALVTDIAGEEIVCVHREYHAAAAGFEALFSSVLAEVESRIPRNMPVLGAGVAIPGVVDPEGPVIEECWSHNLTGAHLGEFLARTFSYPVLMENDANCCAWKTLWYDSRDEDDSFVYLLPRFHRQELLPEGYPSVGVGLGLVYNGTIYNGFTRRAGEFRSLFFEESGNVPGQIALTPLEMNRVSRDAGIRRKLVVELLRTLILFMHISNPRALFVGGDLSSEGDLIRRVLEEDLRQEWDALARSGVQVEVLGNAEYDAARGAAAAVLDTLYSIPRIGGREQDARIWRSLLTNLID